MKYEQKLVSAVLVKRYKRFLADVILEDGSFLTVHCANTGAMTGCAISGSKIWLSKSANLKRKYAYSWELVELEYNAGFIAVNTARANQIVESALLNKKIEELVEYDDFKREVKYGDSSRVDFFLSGIDLPNVYLEVKSVTLHRGGVLGAFPDAVTLRGQKHLRELLAVKKSGMRAVLLFCVLHSEIKEVSVADDIDSVYGQLLRDAIKQGVEVYCYSVDMSIAQLALGNKLVLKV
jgi:sugar fermentation stimulation protein A